MNNIKSKILLYLSTFAVFLLIDFAWIIFGANPIYQSEIGGLLLDRFKIVPALLTYIALVGGLFIFAISPAYKERKVFKGIVLGAVFGAVTYAIFSLTNLSILDGWTLKVAMTDIIWGGVIGAVVSLAGYKLSVAFLR